MKNLNKNNIGGALPLVLCIIVASAITISLVIQRTTREEEKVRNLELVDNVRDGMKGARQYASNFIINYWSDHNMGGEGSIESNTQNAETELSEKLTSYVNSRFDGREGWDLNFDEMFAVPMDVNLDALDHTYYERIPDDAFEWCIGYLERLTEGGHRVRIGQVDNSNNLTWGARVSISGAQIDGRVIYPTNFAWVDVGNIEDSSIMNVSGGNTVFMNSSSDNIEVGIPAYIINNENSWIDDGKLDPEVVSNRTGGIFTLRAVTVEDMRNIGYSGVKPFYTHGGLYETESYNGGGQIVDKYKRPKSIRQGGNLNEDGVVVQTSGNVQDRISKVTTRKNVNGELNFMPFSSRVDSDVSPADFWNNNPVKDNAPSTIELHYENGRPVVNMSMSKFAGNELILVTDHVKEWNINKVAIRDYYGDNYLEFFDMFPSEFREECAIRKNTSANPGAGGSGLDAQCISWEDLWEHLEYTHLEYQNEPSSPYYFENWRHVYESYNDGVIRFQRFPSHSNLSDIALVYDPRVTVDANGNIVNGLFFHNGSAGNQNIDGIYVNIVTDGLTLEERRELSNSALVLVGRRLPNSLSEIEMRDENNNSIYENYGVFLNPNKKYLIGTNGRLTIDSRVNVAPGTILDMDGRFLSTPSPQSGVSAGGLNYKSIFVSRDRPAIAYLGTGQSGSTLTEAELVMYSENASLSSNDFLNIVYHTLGVAYQHSNSEIFHGNESDYKFINAKAAQIIKPEEYNSYNEENTVGVYDMLGEGNEEEIEELLREWARNQLIALFNDSEDGNRYYNTGVAYRLSNPDLIENDDILDTLLEFVGRKEETALVKLYAQTYGWEGYYTRQWELTADANLRIGFSGNIKSKLYVECLDNQGEKKMVSMVGGENNNAANFSNVPYPNLLTIEVAEYSVPDESDNIATRVAFRTPVGIRGDEENNEIMPNNMKNFIEAFMSSEGSITDEIYQFLNENTNLRATTAQMSIDSHLSDWDYSTTSNPYHADLTTRLNASVNALINLIAENENIFKEDPENGGNFYGRIEYTLAVSVDTGMYEYITNPTRGFHATWTLDTGSDDMINPNEELGYPIRVVSVKAESYNNSDFPMSQDKVIPRTPQAYPHVYATLLEGMIINLFNQENRTKVQDNIASIITSESMTSDRVKDFLDNINAFVAERTDENSSVRVQSFTDMPGGILGERTFDYNLNTASISYGDGVPNNGSIYWDFFKQQYPLGHLDELNMENINDTKIYDIVEQTINTDGIYSVREPGRSFTGNGIKRELLENRILNELRTYIIAYSEPMWGTNLTSSSTGSYINTELNTTTSNAINRLDDIIRGYVYARPVRFKLYSNTDGSYRIDGRTDAKSFTGAGILMTSANTPNPYILLDGSPQDISFTWHGTVITGIGSPALNEMTSAKMNSILIGDPLLVGPRPAIRGDNTNLISEARTGLWGTVSVIEDRIPDPDEVVNIVPMLEMTKK